MFEVPIDKIIPVTSARAKIASLVKNVQKSRTLYVLTRGGKPAAILASVDFLKEKESTGTKKQVKSPNIVLAADKDESNVVSYKNKDNDVAIFNDEDTNLVSSDSEQPVKISIN